MAGHTSSLRGKLIRGGVGNALVQAITKLLVLAVGIVLARGLGAEGYGVYAYAFALLTLLMVFAEMGMPTLLIREVAASEARQDWSHLRGILVRAIQIVSLAAIVFAALAALVLWQLSEGISSNQSKTLVWMIALLPVAVLVKTMMAALQGLQHVVKAQAVEMLLRTLLVLLGVGVIFALVPDMRLPQYAMAIQLGAVLVVLCTATFMLNQCLPQPVHTAVAQYQTRQWLTSAMPLTFIGGAGIINDQTDLLMLGFFRTHMDVGIYRVAVQGAALVAFGLQTANAVIAPQFARLYAQGDHARLQHLVTVSARLILLAAFPVALTFILAGGMIAGWVFGSEFTESHISMAILAVGQLINAAIGSVGFLLNMTGHERDVARTLLITAGLNIILNLVLIPSFGMVGAASATAVSLIIWNLMLYKIVKKRIGINSTAFVLRNS